MPNWCCTNYAVTGDRRQVTYLYKRMKTIQDKGVSCTKTDFGPQWLGNLVHSFGKNWEKVGCRGSWYDLRYDRKNNVLYFNTETAWARCEDVEYIIRDHYPLLDIYFISEELGCEIFETNDYDGTYFPDRYIIDNEDEGMEYFTKEDFFKVMTDFAKRKKPFTSFEQVKAWCKRHNDNVETGKTHTFIYVHRAEAA